MNNVVDTLSGNYRQHCSVSNDKRINAQPVPASQKSSTNMFSLPEQLHGTQ